MRIIISLTIFALCFGFGQTFNAFSEQNETCYACRKFSNFVWNLTNNMDDEVYNSLINLCTDYTELPSAYHFCNKTVHSLVRFIKQRWNNDKICYDIKACNNFDDDGIREFSDFLVADDVDCKFCIYVNTKIKELFTGSPTEMEMKSHFENVCHYLKNFEKECVSMVDEYLDLFFQFMKDRFVPENLCKSLRVCPKKTGPLNNENEPEEPTIKRLPTVNDFINVMPVNMSLISGDEKLLTETPTCMICKKIVKIIQRQLLDNATDEQIVNVLQEVCQLFPAKNRDKCQQIVENYVNQLIEILSRDIDSDTACILAGLCGNQDVEDYLKKMVENYNQLNGNALCTECELIAHMIQNEIYDYRNEEQIENFIKNHLCDKMTFIITKPNCQAFIDQYGPIIMQTIAQEIFNPDLLCFKELKLCKKTKIHVVTPHSNNRCDVCQDVVKYLATHPYNNIEMDHVIEKSCSQLKEQSKQVDCALMIKTFAPYFLDMLDRYDNIEKICESVDICLIPGKIHQLGGHKCTYGPSYWCHSITHANSCNAFRYCKRKIWDADDDN